MKNEISILDDTHRVIRVKIGTPVADHHRGTVAVIGNLDGVHLGHQILIDHAINAAKDNDASVGAIIFEPHPRRVFQPDAEPFLLTSLEQKVSLLLQSGVDHVFILPFTEALSSQSDAQFVKDTLGKTLGLRGAVVGAEFQFGKGRTGNAEKLTAYGKQHQLDVTIVTPLINTASGQNNSAEKYSSSQARQSVRNGDPQSAMKVLGRPWSVCGIIREGKRLGQTLGFPTANIELGDLIAPKKGVYAVRVLYQDQYFQGVANFGQRPTINGEGLLLEVHIFDFNETIYGMRIEVMFYEFIRAEQKFNGLDALKAQIAADSAAAKQLLLPYS